MLEEKTLLTDEEWMQRALVLADKAAREGEVPVGAILVKDNQLVAEGWNQSIQGNDPSAHAEMVAVRRAGQALNNYRLVGTTLYVTLEPCPMCAGLLVHSRIQRLVFGAYDDKTGSAGSIMNLVRHANLNHQLEVLGGVLEAQCSDVISSFFKRRRSERKASKNQSSF